MHLMAESFNFIKRYIKMASTLAVLSICHVVLVYEIKETPFFSKSYTKGLLFLSK